MDFFHPKWPPRADSFKRWLGSTALPSLNAQGYAGRPHWEVRMLKLSVRLVLAG
jgi:hypothetical protein